MLEEQSYRCNWYELCTFYYLSLSFFLFFLHIHKESVQHNDSIFIFIVGVACTYVLQNSHVHTAQKKNLFFGSEATQLGNIIRQTQPLIMNSQFLLSLFFPPLSLSLSSKLHVELICLDNLLIYHAHLFYFHVSKIIFQI